MDSSIANILTKASVYGEGCYTHISMNNIVGSGKYDFNTKIQEEFWTKYSDVIKKSKDNVLAIGEKPQHFLPVIADVDLKIESKSEDIPKKLYTQSHIIKTVETYQSVLRNIIDDCTDENLICVVLEKPLYTETKNINTKETITYIKNGFHLHFPYTFVSKINQNIHLVPKVRDEISKNQTFKDIGFDDVSKIIDSGYTKTPWLLYGSRKNDKQGSYLISTIYDAECEEMSIQDAFEDYNIYDENEVIIDIKSDIEYYIPRILSIRIQAREEYIKDIRKNVTDTLKVTFKPLRNTSFVNNNSVEDNIKHCQQLMPLISTKRSDEYYEWMTIGWAFFNISRGSNDGYKLWTDFSRQCPDKFSETVCVYEWQKMVYKEDGLNMGTIIKYARDFFNK